MKPNGFVRAASITSQTSMSRVAAHQGQFVHQADIHGAKRILKQLHHLRHARRRDRDECLHDVPVEGGGRLG